MAITKLVLNGTSYDLGSITYNIDTLNELTGPQTYAGVEIAEDWATIQTAAKAGTTSTLNDGAGLRVGDYKTISMTLNGSAITVVCQVAGIDTYYRAGSSQQSHHVDFISKDCLPGTIVWNESTTATTTEDDGTVTGAGNNGTADVTNPFMASHVYWYLENTVYPALPSDLSAVIAQKQIYGEVRYSASSLISDSTSNAWITMPHLWLPTEYEVFGSTLGGTKYFADRGTAVQYPIFANSWYHRIKGSGNGGGRCYWWLATAYSGSSTNALYVGATGTVAGNTVTGTNLYVPLCFRVC